MEVDIVYKLANPFFMLCETPLHAGSGSDLGVVDLPIQRERHTSFPKVEASGIKGCLRSSFERLEEVELNGQKIKDEKQQVVNLVFGPENGNEHTSAIGITDARLLLFPVKSMRGVFAWITCPRVLQRFKTDLNLCNEISGNCLNIDFDMPDEDSTPQGSSLFVKDNKIILEEYTFEIMHKDDPSCTDLANWLADNVLPKSKEYTYLREKLQKDLVVLSDDSFRDFVNLSTEVVTRIKINQNKGTVEARALFTEEYLPAESILYSLVLASPIFSDVQEHKELFPQQEKNVMEFFVNNVPHAVQLGGNATIGKGVVRVVCYNEG
jgi:CRISPR-associated protein Cmr4